MRHRFHGSYVTFEHAPLFFARPVENHLTHLGSNPSSAAIEEACCHGPCGQIYIMRRALCATSEAFGRARRRGTSRTIFAFHLTA